MSCYRSLLCLYVAWKPPCYIPHQLDMNMKPKSSLNGFTLTLGMLLITTFVINCIQTKHHPSHKHLPSFLAGLTARTVKHRYHAVDSAHPAKNKALLISLLLLCGDIESNPGPVTNAQI
ncbi:hypothetical protein DPMN_190350 [Dreissena polymorpha]|uniref:Uncharacterized protein n=1 Tax=Dreissena polymorpha TaxID=45954 RepID=A0A9D4ID20_DREPO|nr:hypothetical protein DPMN_190350 [Dreissena polymorpha]